MKNKKLLFVLLPIVAVVWGLIAYRVIESLETPMQVVTRDSTGYKDNDRTKVVADSFQLKLGYRDPFLSGLSSGKYVNEPVFAGLKPRMILDRAEKQNARTSPALPEQVEWPQVEYFGLIEHQTKKRRVAMLKINEADFLLSESKTAASLKLVKLLPDSILVEYGKNRQYILKSL